MNRVEPPPTTHAPTSSGRLLNRNFLLLWQGQLVSVLGSQAFAIAMMFWLMEATGSATLMGSLLMLSTLPTVLIGPFAGALADRTSRKRILVVCDGLAGLAALGLAVPFFVPALGDRALTVALFAMAIAIGTTQAFFRPAAAAAIPDLVPRESVASANSMTQGSAQIAAILGQGLGGVLYQLMGAPLLFVLNGVSYLVSAASESLLHLPDHSTPNDDEANKTDLRADLVEGLRYVWANRGMRSFLALAAVVNFFATPVIVLLPFLVSERLGRGAEWYGFLLAGFGAGSLLGYVAAGALQLSRQHRSHVLAATLIASGVLLAALGWTTRPWSALTLFTLAGGLNGFFNIQLVTSFQLSTPPELRGRVMGVVTTVAMAAAPAGMALGGVLGDLTGKNVPVVYGLCGGMIALAASILGWRRSVREFLASA